MSQEIHTSSPIWQTLHADEDLSSASQGGQGQGVMLELEGGTKNHGLHLEAGDHSWA